MCCSLLYRHIDIVPIDSYYRRLILSDAFQYFFRDDQKEVKSQLSLDERYLYVFRPCMEGNCYLDPHHWWGVPWCETEREEIKFQVKVGGYF